MLLEKTLAQYNLQNAQTQSLRSLVNQIYRVTDSDGENYSLRICPVEFRERGWLQDELTWLAYLAERDEISVPVPIPNQTGALVSQVDAPAGTHFSSLFKWVEGETASGQLTPAVMEQVGQITAHLHRAAREFDDSITAKNFRPNHHYDQTLATEHREWIAEHATEIGVENVGLLHAAVDYVVAQLDQVGKDRANYGLIHSDLHFGNFLVYQGQVSVIDFDQLGWGHYNFDIACVMIELQDEPDDFDERWTHFLQGYQTVAPLPFQAQGASIPEELAPFVVANNLAFLDWVYNASNPQVRKEKMKWVPEIYESIRGIV